MHLPARPTAGTTTAEDKGRYYQRRRKSATLTTRRTTSIIEHLDPINDFEYPNPPPLPFDYETMPRTSTLFSDGTPEEDDGTLHHQMDDSADSNQYVFSPRTHMVFPEVPTGPTRSSSVPPRPLKSALHRRTSATGTSTSDHYQKKRAHFADNALCANLVLRRQSTDPASLRLINAPTGLVKRPDSMSVNLIS